VKSCLDLLVAVGLNDKCFKSHAAFGRYHSLRQVRDRVERHRFGSLGSFGVGASVDVRSGAGIDCW
jgi:hypothetical protein